MIRLAVAVGFLAVFGFVAYSIVLLLTKSMKDNTQNNPNPKPKEEDDKVI